MLSFCREISLHFLSPIDRLAESQLTALQRESAHSSERALRTMQKRTGMRRAGQAHISQATAQQLNKAASLGRDRGLPFLSTDAQPPKMVPSRKWTNRVGCSNKCCHASEPTSDGCCATSINPNWANSIDDHCAARNWLGFMCVNRNGFTNTEENAKEI